jgi:hypothetical protein
MGKTKPSKSARARFSAFKQRRQERKIKEKEEEYEVKYNKVVQELHDMEQKYKEASRSGAHQKPVVEPEVIREWEKRERMGLALANYHERLNNVLISQEEMSKEKVEVEEKLELIGERRTRNNKKEIEALEGRIRVLLTSLQIGQEKISRFEKEIAELTRKLNERS